MTLLHRRRALAVLLILSAGVAARAALEPGTYALVGARVITGTGTVLDNGTVILRDGLIEDVGTSLRVPADARVIDVKGLTLTAGLIDGFGGVGLPAPPPRAGGSSERTPSPDPLAPQAFVLDRVRASEALKARSNGVTTALVVPREGVLPGRSVLLNLSGDRPEAMALRQPAALHLHMATAAARYPGSLMGTVAYARQALLDAAHYRDSHAAYETAPRGRKRPRYDSALAAWQEVLAGRQLLIVTATRENDIRRALALEDEFDVKVVIAGAMHAQAVAETIKARGVPLLVSVNFDPPRPAAFFGGSDEDEERREIAEAEKNPAALHRAGVRFALASGHAPDFLAGVRKAIERGLPRDAALRALTIAAAETLGVADRLGSLEPGKIANVVAWSGEPLTAGAKARMVFVDGELFEPEEDRSPSGSPSPSPSPTASPAPAAGRVPPPPPATPKTFAITGATVMTVGPQGTIANGTVIVRDGRIAEVGAGLPVPSGMPAIDARAQYVMPGIIDAHSHTAAEQNINECTDVVTAEVRVADVLDHRDVDIYRELAGGVTVINVLHGSCNAIGGQSAIIKLRWGRPPDELLFREAPRAIKFALGENPKRANFSVPGQRRFPATRMGVEAVLREAFREARAYQREWEQYEKAGRASGAAAPRRNLRLETVRDILDGKIMVHAHCYRSDEILMLIRLAEEFGFRIRVFQHVLEGYKVASEIARHGAAASTFSDWWAYKIEAWDATPYNAAIMAAHGVNVSLNSDSDELARRLYWEAAKAVKYGGVAEDEALKMITINPARQLGVDARVGSIEPGKDADLAIFSAHPFSPDTRVEKTIIEGVVLFDRARDLEARPAAPAGGAR